MNKITGVTRRDIFDLFRKGITEDNWLITENIFYPYYGRFDIVEFLKRLYNLADWESRDSRVDNAEEEIINMEGAALALAAAHFGLPFAELRCVSNVVDEPERQ